MHRRHFLRNTTILTSAGMLFQKNALARLLNVPDHKLTMLRNNVGMYTERGGTIGFLLAPEGIVVIDSQFPDTATNFINEIKKRNTKPLRFLLNTHHHGDHSAGNISFKGIVENVIAHENSLANQKRVAETQNSLDKQLLPDMTFKDEWKLKMGNAKLKAYYFGAAHTNGDAIYHFGDANIMHLGDLVANRRHPFVDRSAGASMRNWITVLDKTIKQGNKNTIYIFGHSGQPGKESGSVADVKLFQDYLRKTLHFAEKEIKAGKSKEEFIKNTSIPGVTGWPADGIQRPLTAAYEELSETKKA
jgi:glyoxylase-like metal-dependent hydrolase (beta-lactamase superfamily II)